MPQTPEPALAQGPGATVARQSKERTEDQAGGRLAEAAARPAAARAGGELVSTISIDVLAERPSRAPDHAAENLALVALGRKMADSPGEIMKALADAALALCRAGSAGLSLLEKEDEDRRFHWRAVAGRWAPHLGRGTPRDFSPCGTAVDRNTAVLFSHPERDFPYFGEIGPPLEEGLLIPFHADGKAVGTIWVASHDERHRFDSEDLRVMTSLGAFASIAYQTMQSLAVKTKTNQDLQHFAALVESSDDAIVSKNLDGIITTWNRGAQRIFGYTAEEAVGRPVTILFPPELQEQENEILARIRRGEHIEHYETIRRHKDGTLIDISLTVSPIKDAAGKVVGASKIARDIRDRRLLQEQQQLLIKEMSHRIRNLFTVTNSVVGLSARYAKTPGDVVSAVQSRLGALTRAHDLTRPGLIETEDQRSRETTLHTLIEAILAPYRSDERAGLIVGGIDAPIAGNAVTGFALVLHEFATNAAKYGSLSSPEGVVRIDCSKEGDDLVLTWREQGGPPLDGQPDHQGFGSMLTSRIIAGHLGGRHSSDWRPEGLVVRIRVPLQRLTA